MLARFTAGLIAIILMVFIPLKYEGAKYALRSENIIKNAIEETYDEINAEERITKEIYEALRYRTAMSGIPCEISITVGTLFAGRNETVINVISNSELLSLIYGTGAEMEVSGKLVTITVVPLGRDPAAGLAGLFWDSYIPTERFTGGGYCGGSV